MLQTIFLIIVNLISLVYTIGLTLYRPLLADTLSGSVWFFGFFFLVVAIPVAVFSFVRQFDTSDFSTTLQLFLFSDFLFLIIAWFFTIFWLYILLTFDPMFLTFESMHLLSHAV